MEHGIEILVTFFLLVVGVSHLARPRAWAQFFIHLRDRGEAGVFVAALVNLLLGLAIVAFHPRFSGVPALVTALGYAWTIKGTLYFVFPQAALRMFGTIRVDRTRHFVAGGWLMVAMSAGLLASDLIGRA